MTFEEFKANNQRLHDTRKHKVTGSLGVYDAYKWIRKNKWLDLERPLTEKEFYSIIRNVNNLIAEELIKGNDFNIPERMGKLELRKRIPFIGYDKDNKLKVCLAIDWDATLKLWYEDEDAYNNKQLVRIPEKEVFKYYYNKYNANYNNKSFFDFNINREIKTRLKQNIKAGKVDAFLLQR